MHPLRHRVARTCCDSGGPRQAITACGNSSGELKKASASSVPDLLDTPLLVHRLLIRTVSVLADERRLVWAVRAYAGTHEASRVESIEVRVTQNFVRYLDRSLAPVEFRADKGERR